MANTFKVKTKAGVTTLATVYTVPSSTTAIVLGAMIGNTTANSVNCCAARKVCSGGIVFQRFCDMNKKTNIFSVLTTYFLLIINIV